MPAGFFQSTELTQVRRADPLLPQCGLCKLNKTCKSPKMPIAGAGLKNILVVGEAPGENEDKDNKPFVGRAGVELQKKLWKFGVDLFRDCWVTNSAICRPPQNKLPDKAPDYCRPNITKAIKDLKPEKVLLLGAAPVRSVIGWLWKEKPGGITQWAGWRIPSQRINAWVCPMYHPSYLLREKNPVLDMYFEYHLEKALALKGRPWKEVPDYRRQVKVILDPDQAAREIRELTSHPGPFAFDYETDRIKPDAEDSRIVCCSISDGKTSLAYPWHGEAIRVTREFLRGKKGKIASHLKFEHRWSLARLGVEVRNWVWDTMLAAHVLDNRRGITGLKFQAFVLLGQGSYNDVIGPYLESVERGGNSPNRVGEVDLPTLLLYCGMDSLLECKVAKVQAKKLGVRL